MLLSEYCTDRNAAEQSHTYEKSNYYLCISFIATVSTFLHDGSVDMAVNQQNIGMAGSILC